MKKVAYFFLVVAIFDFWGGCYFVLRGYPANTGLAAMFVGLINYLIYGILINPKIKS